MADKVVNSKTMEEEILNNPEVYQNTFMVTYSHWNQSSAPIYVKQCIGKDKIKGLQILTKDLMLVTMNNVDDMNDLLASVSNFRVHNQICSGTFTLIQVLPVRARVRIKISGIPLPLASANLKDIKELFIDVAKELKEVVLSLETEEDIQTGNLIVDALTNDLKVTHGNLKSNAGITYKYFHGTVMFSESLPVRKESWGKFVTHSDITVTPWK